jgi:hypothetical protein
MSPDYLDQLGSRGREPDDFDRMYARTRHGAPSIDSLELIEMLLGEIEKYAAGVRELADDVRSEPVHNLEERLLRGVVIHQIRGVILDRLHLKSLHQRRTEDAS